jgi:hypothetical protein
MELRADEVEEADADAADEAPKATADFDAKLGAGADDADDKENDDIGEPAPKSSAAGAEEDPDWEAIDGAVE